MNILRSYKSGQLNANEMKKWLTKNRELLPPFESSSDCRSNSASEHCFLAGDIRVNENVGLTLMHTLWLREHNRIAKQLSSFNKYKSDDEIFFETRKIVGAQLQFIAYNEFLPLLIGEDLMERFDLRPLKSGHYRKYSIDVNPSLANVIESNVLPFLYSMLPNKFERYSNKLKLMGTKLMSDTYFNPTDLYDEKMFDEYLMGLISQNAMKMDLIVDTELMNSVKYEVNEDYDQSAFILQKGRDHGIPSYTQWRKFCKLSPTINDFSDLEKILDSTVAKKLSKLYR